MSVNDPGQERSGSRVTRGDGPSRLSTETKHSTKTSELYVYVAITAAILIAGLVIKGGDGHADQLTAAQAWLYVSIVTLGYLLSRGLAKAGSRDPYWGERDGR